MSLFKIWYRTKKKLKDVPFQNIIYIYTYQTTTYNLGNPIPNLHARVCILHDTKMLHDIKPSIVYTAWCDTNFNYNYIKPNILQTQPVTTLACAVSVYCMIWNEGTRVLQYCIEGSRCVGALVTSPEKSSSQTVLL